MRGSETQHEKKRSRRFKGNLFVDASNLLLVKVVGKFWS